ncbi:hypothetical protein TSAR_010728, partial [Trichomalopsis sarcophagae]
AAPPPPLSKTIITDECGAGSSNDNYLNTVQIPGSEVLRLEDEMNKILNSSELDDRQKYSISEDDKDGNEFLLPTVDKTLPPLHSVTTNGDGEVIFNLHIINSVPPSLRQNARNLINSLRRSGSIA